MAGQFVDRDPLVRPDETSKGTPSSRVAKQVEQFVDRQPSVFRSVDHATASVRTAPALSTNRFPRTTVLRHRIQSRSFTSVRSTPSPVPRACGVREDRKLRLKGRNRPGRRLPTTSFDGKCLWVNRFAVDTVAFRSVYRLSFPSPVVWSIVAVPSRLSAVTAVRLSLHPRAVGHSSPWVTPSRESASIRRSAARAFPDS